MPVPPSVTGALQQPPALGPFMRKLINLLLIARRAGRNDVGDVVASASGQRYNVVSVPYKVLLGGAFLAIIAAVMLTFQLFLELLSGERVASIVARGTTLMIDCFSDCLTTFTSLIGLAHLSSVLRMIILSVVRSSFFKVLKIVLDSKRSVLFSMSLVVLGMIFPSFFFVFLFPLRVLPASLFLMCLVIGLVLLVCACSAYASKSIPMFAESSKGEESLTYTALFAMRGIRGYTGHTDESPFIRHASGCTSTAGANIITPALYHEANPQATLSLSLYPAYSPLEV